MAQKGTPKGRAKLQVWVDARQRYHLSHAQIQMARELGLNPRKFGKLANHRQESWKEPLPQFIESLYFKRFGKTAPDKVFSIEESARELQLKEEARRNRKRQARESMTKTEPEEVDAGSDQGNGNDPVLTQS